MEETSPFLPFISKNPKESMSFISRLCCPFRSVSSDLDPEAEPLQAVQVLESTEHYLSPNHESLELKLHNAIQKSDLLGCRFILDMRANPNAMVQGTTPLELAVKGADLEIAKFLIDYGATVSPSIQSNIQDRLVALQVKPKSLHEFLLRRPKLNEPQIVFNDRFVSLYSFPRRSAAQAGFTKPLALFFIGDESFGPNYGAILKAFDPTANGKKLGMATQFTVVTTFVDDKNQLLPIIDKIRECLPGLPLLFVSLEGHGNHRTIVLGKNREKAAITKQDVHIAEGFANRMHPLGGASFNGCGCAEGPDNLVRWFSSHLKGRLAWGFPQSLRRAEYKICSIVPDVPLLIPFFNKEKIETTEVDLYVEGQPIWRTTYDDQLSLGMLCMILKDLSSRQQSRLTDVSDSKRDQ